MHRKQADTLMEVIPSTPKPSTFALELLRQCSSPDIPLPTCSAFIETDSFLKNELLRYSANPLLLTTSLDNSLASLFATLGRETVGNLGIILSIFSVWSRDDGNIAEHDRFWQKALARGAAARVLAARQNIDGHLFFTYGVFASFIAAPQKLGGPAMTELHQPLAKGSVPDHTATETAPLPPLHPGIALLEGWGLSKPFIRALQDQDRAPGRVNACWTASKIRNILQLSNYFAKICLLERPLTETFLLIEQLAENQNLPTQELSPIFSDIVALWQTLCTHFSLPLFSCPNYHHIKLLDEGPRQSEPQSDDNLTILAADDDPITLLYLEKMLQADHRTLLLAREGDEALQMALERRPQLLITDWRMPGLSGLDLCKILRKTSITQNLYIIMLTSNESDDELVQAFEAGADDYVTKPFTPKVLQARIASGERLIRSQQTVSRDREVIERYAAKLAAANRKLQNMAMTDFLTGVPNRRSALQRLRNLVAEVQRYGEPLSCLMIDIDRFKNINDTYGHDCGDVVLKKITKLLEEKARSYDMVSRWGGEEFLVICARSGGADTYQLAERLRKTVEGQEIIISKNLHIKVTISIGVATWGPELKNFGELIKKADQALYQAKTGGRNRVEPAPQSHHPEESQP